MTLEERRKLKKKLNIYYQSLSCIALCASLMVGTMPKSDAKKSDNPTDYDDSLKIEDLVTLKGERPIIDKENKVVKTPTNEEKILWILEHYEITLDELKDIIGGMIAESYQGGYDEAYRVTSVLYNRICSIKCTSYCGTNIYEQFSAPGQFAVYATGAYQLYRESTQLEEYQAVIDMLYSCTTSVNALSFRSSSTELSISYMQYQPNGNKYFNDLEEEDRLKNEIILTRKEKLKIEPILYDEFIL